MWEDIKVKWLIHLSKKWNVLICKFNMWIAVSHDKFTHSKTQKWMKNDVFIFHTWNVWKPHAFIWIYHMWNVFFCAFLYKGQHGNGPEMDWTAETNPTHESFIYIICKTPLQEVCLQIDEFCRERWLKESLMSLFCNSKLSWSRVTFGSQ